MQLSGLEIALIGTVTVLISGGGGILGTKVWDKKMYVPRTECENNQKHCEKESNLANGTRLLTLKNMDNRLARIEKDQQGQLKLIGALFKGLKIEMPDD